MLDSNTQQVISHSNPSENESSHIIPVDNNSFSSLSVTLSQVESTVVITSL